MKTATWSGRWPSAMLTLTVGLTMGISGCLTGGGVQYDSASPDEPGSITLGPGQEAPPAFDRSTPPPLGRARSLSLPDMEEFTLENGLTVVVVEQDDLPMVSLSLQFPGGARVLAPEQAGLSALVADMMDEGTESRTGFELADAVDRLGASLRSFGGMDANGLQLDLLSPQLDDGLDLLAEVVLHPAFSEEDLERIKNQRLTRILQGQDDPRTLANEAFARALYGEEHPYGQPALGTERSVSALTRDDVLGYYQARYQPGGAVLVATGDVELEELQPRLEALFAGWEAMDGVTPAFPIPAPVSETTILIVDKPDAAQSEIRVGRVAIDYHNPDYLTLNVMNTVLGGSFTSRLNTRLREEKGYSYGAGSGFSRRQLPGPFTASSAVYTPVTDSSVVEFVREIAKMSDEEVPEEELERARNFVALRLPQGFETVRDLGARVAELYMQDLPKDYYETFVEGTLAVSAGDVQDVARRWLDLSRMVIVVAGDRATIEEPLRALGIGPVVVLKAPAPASQEDR